MKLNETADYINHRLKVSGNRIPGLFSSGAVKNIYRFSKGIPRLINVACEQALVMAWTQESLSVTPSIAVQVIAAAKPDTVHRGVWSRISSWLFAGK